MSNAPILKVRDLHACMGVGVAVMTVEFAQRGVREDRLVRIFDDWNLSIAKYFAVWSDTSYRESLVSVSVEFPASSLQGEFSND